MSRTILAIPAVLYYTTQQQMNFRETLCPCPCPLQKGDSASPLSGKGNRKTIQAGVLSDAKLLTPPSFVSGIPYTKRSRYIL